MLCPLLPSACTVVGNNSALATDTTFGLYPFCCDWFQNVVKSGGITTPVTISAFAPRNAEICALKSSVRFWKRPGSVRVKPCLARTGGNPTTLSPQALPSPSFGNRAPTDLLVAPWFHCPVNTATTSSSPQK